MCGVCYTSDKTERFSLVFEKANKIHMLSLSWDIQNNTHYSVI
jgi:hypothetical protein